MKNRNRSAISSLLLFGALALPSTVQAGLDYTTGLDVWLDASDTDGSNNATRTDGDEISTWKNKGTTGVNDAIAILASGGGGGTNGLLELGGGNGGQDSVTLSNTRYQFGQEWGDSANVTMYFVVNQGSNSGANASLLTDYGTVGAKLRNLRAAGGSEGAYLRDEANVTNTVAHGANDLAGEKWATIFYSYDVTTATATWGELGNTNSATNLSFDSTTTFEGTHGGPVTLFSFHDGNNGFDFNGAVSEVLIYDHFLDAAAQAKVEAYLLSKATPQADVDFRITEILRNPDGSVDLTWNSDPADGVKYTILYNANLTTPADAWVDPYDNISTAGSTTSFTIPAAVLPSSATELYFRILLNE